MQNITKAVTKRYEIKIEATTLNAEHIKRAMQVLIDNGIEEDKAGAVLQAIGYTLLDTELDCDGYEFVCDGTLMYTEEDTEYTVI